MAICRITCVRKSIPNGGHEHITHVGNTTVPWEWTVDEVIQSIDNGTNSFYVEDDRTGLRAAVGVVRVAGKRTHIRTYADGYYNDNLLSLGFCPLRYAA